MIRFTSAQLPLLSSCSFMAFPLLFLITRNLFMLSIFYFRVSFLIVIIQNYKNFKLNFFILIFKYLKNFKINFLKVLIINKIYIWFYTLLKDIISTLQWNFERKKWSDNQKQIKTTAKEGNKLALKFLLSRSPQSSI